MVNVIRNITMIAQYNKGRLKMGETSFIVVCINTGPVCVEQREEKH